ncbi:hypothetical protein NKG94_11765 [Micromonospora sp. M12]
MTRRHGSGRFDERPADEDRTTRRPDGGGRHGHRTGHHRRRGAGRQASGKPKPLGTTSLAQVLTKDKSGFDRNSRDFDVLTAAVLAVLEASRTRRSRCSPTAPSR